MIKLIKFFIIIGVCIIQISCTLNASITSLEDLNPSSGLPAQGAITPSDTLPPASVISFNVKNFGSVNKSPVLSWEPNLDDDDLLGYQIALGTSPGATDVLDWQIVGKETQFQLSDLNLTNGQEYYPSIRAIDNVGNFSPATFQNSFRAINKWTYKTNEFPYLFNYSVDEIRLHSDGKKSFLGGFQNVGTELFAAIGRLNSDGSRNSNLVTELTNSQIKTFAIQPDGKIIIAGSATFTSLPLSKKLLRLNSNGSIDSTFDVGSGFNNSVNSVAIQSDGKIIVGGSFTTYDGTAANRIIRLNTDGSIDSSFVYGSGFNNIVNTIVVQADDKILVGGSFTTYTGITKNRIVRLISDGSIDAGFTIGTGFNEQVHSIALRSDAKIMVGGAFSSYNGVNRWSLVRLNSTGTRDVGFNVGDSFMNGFNSAIYSVVIQADDRVVVGGSFTSYNSISCRRLARMNTDGTRDLTFDVGTGIEGDVFADVNSLSLQPDGKILVGGRFVKYAGVDIAHILRVNTDGSLDNSFDVGTGLDQKVTALAYQPDGTVLVGGNFNLYNSYLSKNIVRLLPDDTIDTSLNTGAGFNTTIYDFAVQEDGKYLAGGGFTSYNGTPVNRFIRLNPDGTIDPSLNIGGGFDGTVGDILIQNDGKIIVAGNFTTYDNVAVNKLIRLNNDGTLDNTFSVGTGITGSINKVFRQPDGKIILGGTLTLVNGTAVNKIVRLNIDGSIDSTFNVGSGFDDNTKDILLQPDGKILVTGSFTEFNGVSRSQIARLNSDGTLDATFESPGFENGINSLKLALQDDGMIIVYGEFENTTYDPLITGKDLIRLDSHGKLDTTFNIGSGFSSSVLSLLILPNGKILAGGQSTYFDSQRMLGLVQLGW